MPKNLKKSDEVANGEADNWAARCNSGYIRIYDGTQPAGPSTPISTQVLLAELRFGSTAFGSASAGVATANAITKDSSADNTGTASWFRVLKSDGTTAIFDGSVGTSGCDLNLTTTSIVAGGEVDITSFTITVPKTA